jgi:hypothetical protein
MPLRRPSPHAVAIPLVAVLATATTTAAHRAGRAVPGGPAEFAIVTGGHAGWLPTKDPTLPPVDLGPDASGVTATAVAALGRGRVYYTAGSKGGPPTREACTSVVDREERNETSSASRGIAQHVDGRITELAISPDDTRLAYVALVGPYCMWPVLHVLDLRTDTDLVWHASNEYDAAFLRSLSWAPDSRRLAFYAHAGDDYPEVAGIRVLDTTSTPGDFLDIPVLTRGPHATDDELCMTGTPAFRGAELVAAHFCRPWSFTPEFEVRVVRVDTSTGRLGPTLFTPRAGYPEKIEFDRSGRHALVVNTDGPVPRLYRWDGGRTDVAVDLAGLPATDAAW